MSFGIGAFPFGYFASSLNFGEARPARKFEKGITHTCHFNEILIVFFFCFRTAANRGTTQYEDEQQLSKLFLYLAFLCIAWLLFA